MNIASVNLNLLVVFEAMLEERSVSRAARRAGLSQPAMSNALRRLRQLFNDRLFIRTAAGMTPTRKALALAGPVRSGLAQLRAVLSEPMSFDPKASSRTFYLGMTDYAEFLLLPVLLRRLQSVAPNVQIVVRRLRGVFIPPEAELRSGSLDAAVGFFPETTSIDPAIRSDEMFSESNVGIARRGNPHARPMTLKRFAALEHAAVFYGSEGRGLIDDLLTEHGLRRRLRVASPHFLSVPFIVAAGDLVAVVPEGLAQYFRNSLRLDVFKVPLPLEPLHMRLLWHERAEGDSANRWFRGEVTRLKPQAAQ